MIIEDKNGNQYHATVSDDGSITIQREVSTGYTNINDAMEYYLKNTIEPPYNIIDSTKEERKLLNNKEIM